MNKFKKTIISIVLIVLITLVILEALILRLEVIKQEKQTAQIKAESDAWLASHKGLHTGAYVLMKENYDYRLLLTLYDDGSYTISGTNEKTNEEITQRGNYSVYDNATMTLKSDSDKLGINGLYDFSDTTISNDSFKFVQFRALTSTQ